MREMKNKTYDCEGEMRGERGRGRVRGGWGKERNEGQKKKKLRLCGIWRN